MELRTSTHLQAAEDWRWQTPASSSGSAGSASRCRRWRSSSQPCCWPTSGKPSQNEDQTQGSPKSSAEDMSVLTAGDNRKTEETLVFSDLAGIFGIDHGQISELPGLLPLIEIPFVRLFDLHHFDLDRPLCGHWKKQDRLMILQDPSEAAVLTHIPVAHRKQFFFFFPALHTLTMLRRRSSLGVKMSLCRACLMAVMVDTVKQRTGVC